MSTAEPRGFGTNLADSYGSSIFLRNELDDRLATAKTMVVNATFAEGESGSDTAINVRDVATLARITNSIFSGYEFAADTDHCDLFRGIGSDPDGEGNIDVDPQLDDELHLKAGSLCADMGDDAVAPHTDKDGLARSGVVDMGAFELDGTPSNADPLCNQPISTGAGGHDYWVCRPIPLDWFAANLYCRSLDAHLVTLDDAIENELVRGLLLDLEAVWLGLNDADTEGEWRWADDLSHAYVNWSAGPLPGGGLGEDCAVIGQLDGSWEDEPCKDRRPFVCESVD